VARLDSEEGEPQVLQRGFEHAELPIEADDSHCNGLRPPWLLGSHGQVAAVGVQQALAEGGQERLGLADVIWSPLLELVM
jgi:hypothetical protein